MSSNVTTLAEKSEHKTLSNLTPQTLDEALRFSEILAKSSIVPKDYQGNPGNVLVAVQWGAEIGLPPLQAMQNIAVINGRPSIWGDAMIALVRGSGLLESIEENIGENGEVASCTIKRRGEAPVTRTFTMEDAKRAGLAGKQGPWKQYPKRMLQMRARAWALRDVFPDVLKGIHIAEEAQDMPVERDMGAADVVEKTAEKSRKSRVKAALADKRKSKADIQPVGLQDVLEAISKADDMRALSDAANLAGKLTDDDDIKQAREAYKQRKLALESPALTYAQVMDQLQRATTRDELDDAAANIDLVPDAGQREELMTAYDERAAEMGA